MAVQAAFLVLDPRCDPTICWPSRPSRGKRKGKDRMGGYNEPPSKYSHTPPILNSPHTPPFEQLQLPLRSCVIACATPTNFYFKAGSHSL